MPISKTQFVQSGIFRFAKIERKKVSFQYGKNNVYHWIILIWNNYLFRNNEGNIDAIERKNRLFFKIQRRAKIEARKDICLYELFL